MPKTRTSRSTGVLSASITKAKSRCRLAPKESKVYRAMIACSHCRQYTTCRSAFTCYSKVAHNSEVILVDGREARDKVGILSEGQTGFPSTKGRELGDIVKLDYRLVEAGVVCTVGCTECAGLPLRECIDAGHYQQERLTEDLPAVARRRVKAKPRSGPRLSAAPKTAKRGKGGDDSNGSAGEKPSRSKRVRSGGGVSPRAEDMTGDDNGNPVALKKCRAEGRSDHKSDVVSQDNLGSGEDTVASLAGKELPRVSSCLEDAEVPVDTMEDGACAEEVDGSDVVSQGNLESGEDNRHGTVASLAGEELPPVSSCLEDAEVPVDSIEDGACAEEVKGSDVVSQGNLESGKDNRHGNVASLAGEELPPVSSCLEDAEVPVDSMEDGACAEEVEGSDVVSQGNLGSGEDNGYGTVASLAGGELPRVSSCVEDAEVPVDTMEDGACAKEAEGTRVPVVDSAVCASSEDAVSDRDPARSLLSSAPGCSSASSASALNEANGTHVKPSDEWSEYFNIDNLRASAMAKFRKAQQVELNEEETKCWEELAPLEKALEEAKVKLRGRMRNLIERQAREIKIFHSVLYGSTVPMTL